MAKRYNITKRSHVEAAATARDLCTRLINLYTDRMKECYAEARACVEANDEPGQCNWLGGARENLGLAGRYRNMRRQCCQRIVRYIEWNPLT